MKSKFIVPCLSLLILLGSCSEDVEKFQENFYMEFMLDETSYFVSNKAHKIEFTGGSKSCNYSHGYVQGNYNVFLWDPKYESHIHSVSFSLTKKVYKDVLDLSDESSYMEHVLKAEHYGFPTDPNGYFSVYDLENDIYEVPRNVSAEGYLSIVTNDEQGYHSASVVPNDRDQSSYLIIDKVVENKKDNNSSCDYIVEGRFKVNIIKRYSTTDHKILEGKFRLPIMGIPNSELLELCD